MAKVLHPSYGSKRINEAFLEGGDIVFKKGKYYVTSPIMVKDKTNVVCEDGVIIYKKCGEAMIQFKRHDCTTKYKGISHVTWKGGTLIGITSKIVSSLVEMAHANDITFDGVELLSVKGLHFFEINSSRNVTIRNCYMHNHLTGPNRNHKEAIQIDFASVDGLPNWAEPKASMYDGWHCKGITVEYCKFEDVPVCIGTHTVTASDEEYHEMISIHDNVAIGRKMGKFVNLLNMRDVDIYDNDIRDFEHGIYFDRRLKAHEVKGGVVKLDHWKINYGVRIGDNKYKNVKNPIYMKRANTKVLEQ